MVISNIHTNKPVLVSRKGVASKVRAGLGRGTHAIYMTKWDTDDEEKKDMLYYYRRKKLGCVENLVRRGGDCIDEKVWERCKWVHDCGPVGMLCLWQRYEAQTAD